MTTHFSIPAWKIPWSEEPGGLQSMGSQKSRTEGLKQQQYYSSSFVSHTILHVNNILINMNVHISHLLH